MFRSFTKMGLAAMALLIGLPLAGCTALSSVVPPTPKTAAQGVYELKTALVAAEDAAITFATTVCTTTTPCTDSRVVALSKAILTADTLVSTAETAVTAGTSSTSALTDAQAAVKALQTLVTQYASSKG